MQITDALQTIELLTQKNSTLEEENKKLYSIIKELKRVVFGSKSEKFESIDEDQAANSSKIFPIVSKVGLKGLSGSMRSYKVVRPKWVFLDKANLDVVRR
jgi:hypothetical protein